jgi:hypothetical protein
MIKISFKSLSISAAPSEIKMKKISKSRRIAFIEEVEPSMHRISLTEDKSAHVSNYFPEF